MSLTEEEILAAKKRRMAQKSTREKIIKQSRDTSQIFEGGDFTKEFPETQENKFFKVGKSEMQGRRAEMEDAILMKLNLRNNSDGIFGVFDGHGGSVVQISLIIKIGL
jgi:hypothetical protein